MELSARREPPGRTTDPRTCKGFAAGILGKKLGMTQIFRREPVGVVKTDGTRIEGPLVLYVPESDDEVVVTAWKVTVPKDKVKTVLGERAGVVTKDDWQLDGRASVAGDSVVVRVFAQEVSIPRDEVAELIKDDDRIPVTVIQAGPCVVLQVKTEATDGYNAVQLGFDEKKPKRTTRPLMGHFAKAGTTPKRLVREFRCEGEPGVSAGDVVHASVLAGARLVDVQGTSKGKGTAGVMKLWNFGGGRASHGNSKAHRKPGSIGRHYGTSKGVPKNHPMAGHMGSETVTVRGFTLVEIDVERSVILIKGSVPGANGSYVIVRRSIKDPVTDLALEGMLY